VQTHVARHAELDVSTVAAELVALHVRAAKALSGEGFADPDQRFQRTADLRYFGQAFEVRVPVADGPFDQDMSDAAVTAFHDAHERLYGYCFRDKPEQEVEWVNLRVTGIGPITRPPLRTLSSTGAAVRPSGMRSVCFDADGFHPTPTYWRPDLPAGATVDG